MGDELENRKPANKKSTKKKTTKKKVSKTKSKRIANTNKTSKATVRSKERQLKALEYRIAGMSYSVIAAEIGISKTNAHKLVTAALRESTSRIANNADDLRDLDLERLDKLIIGLWSQSSQGSPPHVAQILKVMEQRQRLTGVEAAPQVLGQIIAETGSEDKPRLSIKVNYVRPEPSS